MRLKRKVGCVEASEQQRKDSHHFHTTTVATSIPEKDSPETRLKKRIGCIDVAITNKSLEMDYDLNLKLALSTFVVVRLYKNKVSGKVLICKTLPKWSHLNIVTLHGVYEDIEYFHLLMELCVGITK